MELSEISINYSPKVKLSALPKVLTSKDAETQFRSVWSNKMEYIEEMYLMILNRANKVLGYSKISHGGMSGTVVDTKVVFQTALKAHASSIMLAHNHPSGNLKPSEADLRITKIIKEAGRIMEIPLLDHIILTQEGYYSFADEGILLSLLL
ncbi:MAG: repair protein [Bacteroidetes bacterium]|nr:repair protein [Bacteroidota bacterium]